MARDTATDLSSILGKLGIIAKADLAECIATAEKRKSDSADRL